MIAAAAAGENFDASLGAQAKLRSKHNTFLAVPVVFLMLSNHFPVATYGNRYSWQILLALVVAGWGTAQLCAYIVLPQSACCCGRRGALGQCQPALRTSAQ